MPSSKPEESVPGEKLANVLLLSNRGASRKCQPERSAGASKCRQHNAPTILDEAHCRAAVRGRDPRFDGCFVLAVEWFYVKAEDSIGTG